MLYTYYIKLKRNSFYIITRIFGLIGLLIISFSICIAQQPVVSLLGIVFFAIGAVAEIIRIRRIKQIARLKAQGTLINAQYLGVQLNKGLEVNGKNPYRVVCQWLNPNTDKIHQFHSENIWYNPEAYIKQDSFKVYIQPENFNLYYMDISSLPNLVN